MHTGQQERYDGQYGAYADYDGRDAYQDRYGDDGTAPPAGKPGKGRQGTGKPLARPPGRTLAASAGC